MEDRTFLKNNHPTNGISDTFRQFIEALVEEVVIEGKPFDEQKKWLRKHSEAEGISYETIESNLNDLFEAVKELKEHESIVIERSIKALAKDCYLSETMVSTLTENAAEPYRDEVEMEGEVETETGHRGDKQHKEEVSSVIGGIIVVVVAVVCILLCVRSCSKTPFKIEKGSVYCTSKRIADNIEIPLMLDEQRVSGIGDCAFKKCTKLVSVSIPNSVTRIGDHAFTKCSRLSLIVMPKSVLSIGDGAFRQCTNLASIVIPDSVTSIGDEAFSDCTSLSSITISKSLTSIGDKAFFCCYSLTSIVIPNSVTSIGKKAFSDCTGLSSIVIPNSVTSIGKKAFKDCPLKEITISRRNYRKYKRMFPKSAEIIYID